MAVSLYAVALYIVALCLNSAVEILKCQRSFKWKPLCKYFPTILFNMLCALKWILLSIASLCYLISRSNSVREIFKCDLSDVSFVLAFSCGTVSCKGLHRILRLTGRVHRHSGRVSIPYRLRYRSICRPTIGSVSISTSTDNLYNKQDPWHLLILGEIQKSDRSRESYKVSLSYRLLLNGCSSYITLIPRGVKYLEWELKWKACF